MYQKKCRAVLLSACVSAAISMAFFAPLTASAELPSPFVQSLAIAASADDDVAGWYRDSGYSTLWTGAADTARREAFFAALETAHDHGLPAARYDLAGLRRALDLAVTEGDRAQLEFRLTKTYLYWAQDLTSGLLEPKSLDPTIVREIRIESKTDLLNRLAKGNPQAVLASLLPQSEPYLQLMKAKIALERQIASGGWGPEVPAEKLGPGDSGPAVVALRNRLVVMGYLGRSATAEYDREVQRAVLAFQLAHGLPADGVAGPATIVEVNVRPEARLKSIIVAMERERWLEIDRSVRHIWVNQPDFTARIIDEGRTVFRTRVVIGKNVPDQRSPEFSDQMEHMVVNPSWGVPRSITVKEYLPLLQSNRNAVGHLDVIDRNGKIVPRGAVNFAAYTASNFPFALRQAPSDDNALGKVKFMFPNQYNIYLHDTPSKSLFSHDIRAYSHGCIRVANPFDLAYALLSVQSETPEEDFNARLQTGREAMLKLNEPVPVHLVYFTAYPEARGRMGYRRDVYGRDALIWEALSAVGVVLASDQR